MLLSLDNKIKVAAYDQARFKRLIPKKSIKLLPFNKKSINEWNPENIDVGEFLAEVFDIKSEMTLFSGRKVLVSYRDYWKTIYDYGVKKFIDLAQEFEEVAHEFEPVRGSVVKKIETPSFLDDVNFGGVAKYYIAFNGIISNALSENCFYSLSHLLESQEELNCSILLSKNLFYKQAVQMLRSYIEMLITVILFTDNSKAFQDWIKGIFRTPPLRGRNGLLNKMSNSSIISGSLAKETGNLYGELNGFIHSAEGNLIHRGSFKGQYKGFIFDYTYFESWAKFFIRSVEVGIKLLDIHFIQFLKKSSANDFCDICHKNKFDKDVFNFAGETFNILKCLSCNHTQIIRPGMGKTHIVSFEKKGEK